MFKLFFCERFCEATPWAGNPTLIDHLTVFTTIR
jgi:hypothetical protein